MSYTGWSSTNYVTLGSGLVSAAPLSIACWFKMATVGLAANRDLVAIGNSGGQSNRNTFRLNFGFSPDSINASTSDGGATSAATTATAPGANTWCHAAGVWASAASRSVFINGAGKVSETTSRTPTGITNTFIGRGVGSVPDNLNSGDIVAEVGVWNVALDDAEVAALAKGTPPALVRPQSLIAYLPLVRDLVDYKGNGFSVAGSLSATDHPPIIGLLA